MSFASAGLLACSLVTRLELPPNLAGAQSWTADSAHAPDLQEIKTHRLAKESGQLDGLCISEDGRSVICDPSHHDPATCFSVYRRFACFYPRSILANAMLTHVRRVPLPDNAQAARRRHS